MKAVITLLLQQLIFDEAFLFDPNAKISIKVTDTKTKNTQTSPMILKKRVF